MFKIDKKNIKLINKTAYILAFSYTVINVLLRDSDVGNINDRKIILVIGLFLGLIIVITELILHRLRKKEE